MPYVTSIERFALRKGMRMGIATILRMRFGDKGLELMAEIEQIHEEETLRAILKALGMGASLDEVRRLWAPGPS